MCILSLHESPRRPHMYLRDDIRMKFHQDYLNRFVGGIISVRTRVMYILGLITDRNK